MGKILCFVYNEMADFEMTLATHLLGMFGKEIALIAYEKEVITSKPGVTYFPGMTVQEALSLEEVDGILIPGGWNRILKDELKELLLKLHSEGKLLASICAGPEYFAKAGILKDYKYTTTLTEEFLKQQGLEDSFPRENYVKEAVVRDRNLITAVGNAFVDFGVELACYFEYIKSEADKQEYAKHYKGLL